MPWMRLLGQGPPEFIPAVVIESDASRLRVRAQEKQADWFTNPDLDHQREYGYALMDWAKATKNPNALAHAKKLLELTSG